MPEVIAEAAIEATEKVPYATTSTISPAAKLFAKTTEFPEETVTSPVYEPEELDNLTPFK